MDEVEGSNLGLGNWNQEKRGIFFQEKRGISFQEKRSFVLSSKAGSILSRLVKLENISSRLVKLYVQVAEESFEQPTP